MSEHVYTDEALDAVRRAAKLEIAMEIILSDPRNIIQTAHRVTAEVAIYGIDKAIERMSK